MTTDRFLDYIAYEKRYSQHTIIAYRSDLDQFYDFLSNQYNFSDINKVDHQVVRSWIVSLMESGHTPRSVNRKISTLKSYFRFLVKEDLIRENPMGRVIAPKTSQRLPVFVEQESMQILFDEINFGEGYPAARDRMIMEIFYATGMRLSELINLKEADVDMYKNTLKVTGKRNKQRIIPFTGNLVGILNNYLEVKRKTFPGKNRKVIFS